jgi:hypothetical protein
LLVEAQAAVQAAAVAASDVSERLRGVLAERDALQGELRALQRRAEAAPLARRDERLLAQLKVGPPEGDLRGAVAGGPKAQLLNTVLSDHLVLHISAVCTVNCFVCMRLLSMSPRAWFSTTLCTWADNPAGVARLAP